MKIEDRRISDLVIFERLKNGDIFEFDGVFYMRVDRIINAAFDPTYNAVRLRDGIARVFRPSDDVRKLNAKLVIEDREDEVTDE